jgi:hypothetical protein
MGNTSEKKFSCPRCKRPHVLTLDWSNEIMRRVASETLCFRCAESPSSDHPMECDPTELETPRDPLSAGDRVEFQFPVEGLSERDLADLTTALGEIFHWIIAPAKNLNREDGIKIKQLALLWVLRPDYFGGEGVSAAEVCRQFNLPKNRFSEQCSEATRIFAVKNRAQAHGWNRREASEDNSRN